MFYKVLALNMEEYFSVITLAKICPKYAKLNYVKCDTVLGA